MDPFRLTIALLPLAVYLLLIGLINLARRPLVVSGARDTAALAVAVSGLVVVGPMQLFMPQAAAIRFNQTVWLFLIAFYALCISLWLMLSWPRLVIYNVRIEQLRPVLAEVVAGLDPSARWAGDSLVLPKLGVQLHLSALPGMRHVSLLPSGYAQNFAGWKQLERALTGALNDAQVAPNPRGFAFIALALLIVVACFGYMLAEPELLAQGIDDLMRP